MTDVVHEPWPPEGTRWACVVVYRYPSRTEPIIVNVTGHDTRKQAESYQRKVRQQAKRQQVTDNVIAVRVRPILEQEHFS